MWCEAPSMKPRLKQILQDATMNLPMKSIGYAQKNPLKFCLLLS